MQRVRETVLFSNVLLVSIQHAIKVSKSCNLAPATSADSYNDAPLAAHPPLALWDGEENRKTKAKLVGELG